MAAPVHPAVLTGPTSGIGRQIALGLAQAGLPLILIIRNQARGEQIRTWITQQIPAAPIELIEADLGSLTETMSAARAIAARHPRLSLLVNNAGVFRARRERTPEGRDLVLAVNHLAPFILMRDLEPALRAGAPSQIVTVGSSTSDRARISPEDLELARGWTMVRAYSQSKLAVMMATFDAAVRLERAGVAANVVHPGAVATKLVRSPGVIGLAWRLMAPWLRTEQQGADTPLHVALSDSVAATTGRYFKDRKPVPPNPRALDPVLRQAVRQATERLLNGAKPPAAPSPLPSPTPTPATPGAGQATSAG